ncbi:MAG: hypothetical protein LBT84_01075 [Spirochaetia bacterium]|jgi:signal transduction histidine kinase|nr:hypothetical protein [Spirochaetia bacterium]
MVKEIRNILLKGLLSGSSVDPLVLDEQIRRILFNILLLSGGIVMGPLGVYHIYQGRTVFGVVAIVITAVFILVYLLSFFKIPFFILSLVSLLSFMILCGFSLHTDFFIIGMLLSLLFPIVLLIELNTKLGVILSILMGCYIVFARFPSFFTPGLEQDFHIAGSALYIVILVLTFFQVVTKNYRDSMITNINNRLTAEHEQMTAMKDNLKTGIFLMDTDCIIQPQYSNALKTIMGLDDLEDSDFITLLSSSVTERERSALRSFFNMVVRHTHDASTLEEANPLSQFTYIHTKTLEAKTLRCSFSAIVGESGATFILGTIDDISKEIELEQQLSEEDAKRQSEMNALFEVIHVDPRVLIDFIEDTEYEFLHINNTLKNDDKATSEQILKEISRSVHAIKSNALILGLNSYSKQLHAYEDEIKKIRDSETEPELDGLLHLTFHLENLMQTNDEFKSVIDKISAFSENATRKEETKVFAELLERTVERTAEAKNKSVNFTINAIDDKAITMGPRRMIKEILLQLIRNAVTHGIESPEERKKAGKDETGSIILSITLNDNNIEVILDDDGMGINYAAVAEHAEKLNLIASNEKTNRSKLLQLLFSDTFSTAKIVDMYAGRGAGLSVVKRIVTELHGTLKVKTKDRIGVRWTIIIPFELDTESIEGSIGGNIEGNIEESTEVTIQ